MNSVTKIEVIILSTNTFCHHQIGQAEVSLFPKYSLKTYYKWKSSWDARMGLGPPGTKYKAASRPPLQ